MRTTASALAALAAAVALTTLAPAALQAQPPVSKAPEAPSDVAAPPADAVKMPSGLATKVLQPGTGDAHPTLADKVTVHYAGWTTDGRPFDSSYGNGRPVTFALNRMIAGWKEGLQLMVAGEKRRLWVPQELAYGGRPGKPAGMLVFDIELVSIEAAPKPPADLVEPPADAQKSASGLVSKVLQAGTGTEHPKATSTITSPRHRVDDRREGVRQLGGARPAAGLPPLPR